jgi:hypothetical protein
VKRNLFEAGLLVIVFAVIHSSTLELGREVRSVDCCSGPWQSENALSYGLLR